AVARLEMTMRRQERVRRGPRPASRARRPELVVADEPERLRAPEARSGSVFGQDDLRLGSVRGVLWPEDAAALRSADVKIAGGVASASNRPRRRARGRADPFDRLLPQDRAWVLGLLRGATA